MSRADGLFVTGTDTEVGKTVVAAGLVLGLRARGLDAGYCKPVATDGLDMDGRLVSPDALWVRDMAGLDDPWAVLNPFCLRHPLSPLAAGRLENISLSLPEVLAATRGVLTRHDFTVVEGVGGLLVPLAEGVTVLDLLAGLKLPALLVGRPGLGTINHSLLTIKALKGRGIEVAGFCFSCSAPPPAAEAGLSQNAEIIAEFSQAPFWGSLPYVKASAENRPHARILAELAGKHLDLRWIISRLNR